MRERCVSSLVKRFALLAFLASLPRIVHAQRVVVRVDVIGENGRPLQNAELSIRRDSAHVLARGLTDSAGRAVLTIRRDTGSLELAARRLGYSNGVRTFNLSNRDSVSLRITLSEVAKELSTVNVTADEDLKHKHLFIDSLAIANSPRPIHDGADIITKLRPDMVHGLGGRDFCPAIREIWINGRRMQPFDVTTDEVAIMRAQSTILKPRRRAMTSDNVPDYIISILARIKPEHVAEMSYHDCMNMSANGGMHKDNALYVVLKQGIGYNAARGTFVLGASAENASIVALTRAIGGREPYRRRLLGVFADDSGLPIDSCVVTDSATGTNALTTLTGTVSLAFLPPGESTLRIAKPGYKPTTLRVVIAPTDTVPITVTLLRPR